MSVDVVERAPVSEELAVILSEYEAGDGASSGVLAPQSGSPKNGVYFRKTVRKTEAFEIASFHFLAGTATTLHGHSEAAALIKVGASGSLMEESFVPVYCDFPAPGCQCAKRLACRFRYGVRIIGSGESSFLPIGAYHRIHCISSGPTFNVYYPLATDPVAPVPREVMVSLLSAKHDYLQVYAAIARAPSGAARGGIEEVVRRYAGEWARREREQNLSNATRLHADTVHDFRATAILSAPIPAECGGFGDSLATVTRSIRALAAVAPATALSLAMPLGNAAAATMPQSAVAEEHRAALHANTAWLVQQIVQERQILAVANSEPGSGGELKQTKTTARLVGGRYELTGRKSFATIGPDADFFMCAARRVDEDDSVDGFFVKKAHVELDTAWDPLGMRPTASVGLTLTNAPAEAMLGFPGSLAGANARHWSTLMFTAVFVGVAEGALRTLSSSLDAKSKESHYVRSTVANLALQIDSAAGFLEALASDPSTPYPSAGKERCNNAKSFAARLAVETATQVSMLSGGRAYKASHVVSQMLRDSLAAPLLRPPYPKVMDGLAAVWLDAKLEEAEL